MSFGQNTEKFHQAVMVKEVLAHLLTSRREIVVDCTLGDGGHSLEILKNTKMTFLIGIDVDSEAVSVARRRLLGRFWGRVIVEKGDYRILPTILASKGIPSIDAALLDLGVSSRQLDRAERGFTYWGNAPLDMRMNPESPKTARDIVMTYSEEELERIIREYGEERFARQIAREIVRQREVHPLNTAEDLVAVIKKAIGARLRRIGIHPARRTFQALRIETNDELSRLEESVENAFYLLKPGGSLLVISYHSLEDRTIKKLFKRLEAKGLGKLMHKKVIRPSEAEIQQNPRSRSARLRVVERRDF